MHDIIVATDVLKRFRRVAAVDRVSFHVQRGQAVALWGGNGAGKTTLIRCLLGVLRFHGEITIDGLSARRRGKRARSLIGYVPQELAFHDDMRLASAMQFFAALRGASRGRAKQLLAKVGLAGHGAKRVRDLSGGMKQRLALAIAMLADPPIIVLDEPTSNLDAAGRTEVMLTLSELKSAGKTIIFASHRPDEVSALADRTLVLERGRLLQDTTPAELWPEASPTQTMRLILGDGREAEAADLLRLRGHCVQLNGHGLCVAAGRGGRAAAITLLARSDVDVRDFELLDDHRIDGEQS